MTESPNHDGRRALSFKSSAWRRLNSGLFIVLALAGLIRVALQDRVPIAATIYYAFATPVLCALSVVGLLLAIRTSRRGWIVVWLAMVSATGVWAFSETVRWRTSPSENGSLKILCWNACRGGGGWTPGIADVVQRSAPDIAVLIEAGGHSERLAEFWDEHCPEYTRVTFANGMLCLVKGKGEVKEFLSLAGRGQVGIVEAEIGTQPVRVALVDLKSNPLRSREAPLAELARLAEAWQDRPTVIAGDFNTPADSVHFGPLRTHYHEAFETAGRGYAPTWPMPLPVLDLDHTWLNDFLKVVDCKRLWTRESDHRPVVTDVSIMPVP